MISEDVSMAVCADVANQVRGKGFPAKERQTRVSRGVGWVPTNSLITCFNSIADGPFGSVGDLLLIPDERAEVRVDFNDGSAPEHFISWRHSDFGRSSLELLPAVNLAECAG